MRTAGTNSAGLYTLLLGGFALYVLWRWSQGPRSEYLIGLAIVAGAALVLAAFHALELSQVLDVPGAGVAWGLLLTIAGSAGLLLVAGLLLLLNRA